jgi:hypothetical protein
VLLQPEPPQTGKFEGGAAKVQPGDGVQYVDLNAFDPPKHPGAMKRITGEILPIIGGYSGG